MEYWNVGILGLAEGDPFCFELSALNFQPPGPELLAFLHPMQRNFQADKL